MENKDLQFGIIKTVANTDDYQLLTHILQILDHKGHPDSFPSFDGPKTHKQAEKNNNLTGEALPNEVTFYQNMEWLSE